MGRLDGYTECKGKMYTTLFTPELTVDFLAANFTELPRVLIEIIVEYAVDDFSTEEVIRRMLAPSLESSPFITEDVSSSPIKKLIF